MSNPESLQELDGRDMTDVKSDEVADLRTLQRSKASNVQRLEKMGCVRRHT
jgi:hypothetical protein